jgi:prepilin peptidase CpaA
MLEIALIVFFPFMMIFSAFSDLVSMTISNKVSVALIAGFSIFALWTGMDLVTFGWHFVLFAIVLAISFALFAVGAIGGGDAKLAASTVLWLGWEHTLTYFVMASILGAMLTLILVRLRGNILPVTMEGIPWITRLYRADTGVPYGIALGFSALYIYPDTEWMRLFLEAAAVH